MHNDELMEVVKDVNPLPMSDTLILLSESENFIWKTTSVFFGSRGHSGIGEAQPLDKLGLFNGRHAFS